jgi:hypothetical protein
MEKKTWYAIGAVAAAGIAYYLYKKGQEAKATTVVAPTTIAPSLTPNKALKQVVKQQFDIVFSHGHPSPEASARAEQINLSRYQVDPNKIHPPLYL